MGSAKNRWKISFHKSSPKQNHSQQAPIEFLCPISNSLMADPVIVTSGHTFERNCVTACLSLSYHPLLPNGAVADFTTIIPNLALKSTILNWCRDNQIQSPLIPIDLYSAEKIVRKLTNMPPAELTRTPSELSVATSCYSSSSSSCCDIEVSVSEDEELVTRLKSSQIYEQEEALIALRKLTRTKEEVRAQLCTPRLLSTLKSLISSRYSTLQVNAVASLVNLSLEKRNKVRIVRSGIVPPLIDCLRSGFAESQEHAAGALFSLSLDDQNKTALGVLGALPPLIHSLRSESERTRSDSALALYHLSLVQSNRVKMIKLGSVQTLLGMLRAGQMPARVTLILCNMAGSVEGREALLDGGAVECLVRLLREEGDDQFDVATRDGCLTAFYGLSYGGLRFKGLAKEAGAEEVLGKVEENGSERAKEKARRVLEVLRKKDEEEEEIDWEELLNSEDDLSKTMSRLRRET